MNIVPCGDFYKKKEAVKIVADSIHKKKTREKMLRLLDLIPQKKSLYLALKGMNDRNIVKVMDLFAQLNVSPVMISIQHKINHLENLYSYLLNE